MNPSSSTLTNEQWGLAFDMGKVSTHFGPRWWYFLESICMQYARVDQKPTAEEQKSMKELINSILDRIPCIFCKYECIDYRRNHPVDATSGPALYTWLWKMHNHINQKLRKHTVSLKDAVYNYTMNQAFQQQQQQQQSLPYDQQQQVKTEQSNSSKKEKWTDLEKYLMLVCIILIIALCSTVFISRKKLNQFKNPSDGKPIITGKIPPPPVVPPIASAVTETAAPITTGTSSLASTQPASEASH